MSEIWTAKAGFPKPEQSNQIIFKAMLFSVAFFLSKLELINTLNKKLLPTKYIVNCFYSPNSKLFHNL